MNQVVDALSLLTPFDIDKPKIRIGPKTDGGYVLADCLSPGQTVLSYGIGTEYQFDIEMAHRGHHVYMFDHTIEPPPIKNANIHFFQEGIGNRTDVAKALYGLADHLRLHHIAGDGLILKMDVEGAEFDAFEAADEATLARFEQIVMEVHGLDCLDDSAFRSRFCKLFRKLNQAFTLFHVHANNWDGQNRLAIVSGVPVSPLLELSYVRSARVNRRPSATLYPTPLDYPNVPQHKDKPLWFYPFLPTSLDQERFAACAERIERFHKRKESAPSGKRINSFRSRLGLWK